MRHGDRGVAAVWVAVTAMFLLATAALALDVSGAFNTARTDQTTADLACLAGVKELPNSPGAAIAVTVDYVEANWPEMGGQTLTMLSATSAEYSDGSGNTVFIDVADGGDSSKAHVEVTEIQETFFGKAIGVDEVAVSQEAWCRVEDLTVGGGGLPFGAQPGGFNGNLQTLNPCETGNCGPLVIDRDDVSGTSATLIRNIADGPDRILVPDLDTLENASCWDVGAGEECSVVTTDPGVSASHLGEGMLQRLERGGNAGPLCSFGSRQFNCDTPEQILGSAPTELSSMGRPAGWNDDLHGDFDSVSLANHYYFSGQIARCDSPRLGFMPIVSEDLSWDLGDPIPPYPNGKKNVKVVGFYWVIITDPDEAGDWKGNGNLKQSSADIIWFAPGTKCADGTPFEPGNPALTGQSVALVDETG